MSEILERVNADFDKEFSTQITIDGIKRQATKIKKAEIVSHSHALNLAAQRNGYNNFAHAHDVLVRNKPK